MTPRSSDTHHPGEAHLQDIGQRLNWLRAGVLGANDGIVSTAGVVIGVAAAAPNNVLAIATAGIAAIVAGAFSGLEEIVSSRVGRKGIGFGAELHAKRDEAELFSAVLPEDLHKFGLIPEFIGRLPVVTTVSPLDRTALMEILTEPRNALMKQYQRMFEIDGVELEFEQDALEAIADLAVLRQTGARGLRAIMEEVLGPIMFDVPSDETVARVIVTRAAVDANAAPTIVPRKPRRQEKSA